MFEKLCGKDALQNVIIITTMWDTVGETWGLEQEEILFEETYWRAITNWVSRTARYLNSRDSAWDILDSLLRCKHRCPTRLQTEMVDMRRELHETAAGRSWGVQAYFLRLYVGNTADASTTEEPLPALHWLPWWHYFPTS